MTRWKLRAIRWLLWCADALICSLPSPARRDDLYGMTWGTLSRSTCPSGSSPLKPMTVGEAER
jgi:hypothetical protein